MKFFNLVSIMFSHHSGKNGMCCKFISHPESEFQIPQVIFALFLGPWSDRAGHIKMLIDKCRQFEGTFEKSLWRKFIDTISVIYDYVKGHLTTHLKFHSGGNIEQRQ